MPSGRIRRNYEFHEARELVRGEAIGSREQFFKWYKANNPARIPKRPDRAYKHEFKGWNDFLGNNNPFPCVKKSFRSYKEARQFAHTLNLKNKAQWIAYAKDGDKPVDIPSRPDIAYQKTGEWFSWKEFLGYDIIDKIQAVQEQDQYLFIIRYNNLPTNVYRFGITNAGLNYLKEKQQKDNFQIIRVFQCIGDSNWKNIISRTTSVYAQTDKPNTMIAPNIFQTINDLMMDPNLLIVTP